MTENDIRPGTWADFFGQLVYVTSVDTDTAHVRYCEPSGRTGTFTTTALVEDLVKVAK
jgi:hypothetical protein